MAPKVFQDPIGQTIKTRLMNYALDKYKDKAMKTIINAVHRTDKIVEITREALVESLKAESDLLIFKQTFGEPIPTLFISGILHSIDILDGKPSIGDE